MKKVAVCLHDVLLSGGGESAGLVEAVSRALPGPLTVHLVADIAPDAASPLLAFLGPKVAQGSVEVVFHGLTHACPRGAWPLLGWYHRGQAEYAVNDPAARSLARETYTRITSILGRRAGVCPPCWLWTKENRRFFASLGPPYLESMLNLERGGRRRFSPVVSIGSPRERDLFALELVARAMTQLARVLPDTRTRIAVHPCDTVRPRTMEFFRAVYADLAHHGAEPVLLGGLTE